MQTLEVSHQEETSLTPSCGCALRPLRNTSSLNSPQAIYQVNTFSALLKLVEMMKITLLTIFSNAKEF
jgi:hypothetical protein